MNRVRIIRLVAIAVLALSAFWGFTNGPREVMGGGYTALQKGVGVLQIGYALSGVLGLMALWFRPAWALRMTVLWAVLLTATVVLAVFAWPTPWRMALTGIVLFAGAGALMVQLMRTAVASTVEPGN